MPKTTLKIEPTDITPSFKLDLREKILEFKGRSLSCASQRFFTPIMQHIEYAFERGTNTLTANFDFEYFNTSSSKCVFDILKKLATYKSSGADVVINWIYEKYDEDMKEAGEDYENILGVSFNYIQK